MASKHAIEETRPVELTLHDELALLEEDDVFEMVNLTSKYTGIEGVVFISSNMPKLPHGPRVKYFQKAGKGQPSFSVSVGAQPRVVATSLSDRVVNRVAPQVQEWVMLNRAALLTFWNVGESWSIDELNAFVAGLAKLPSR